MIPLAILLLALLCIGYYNRKELLKPIQSKSYHSPPCQMYNYIPGCVMSLFLMAVIIFFCALAGPTHITSQTTYDMVQVNNAYLVSTNTTNSGVLYSYSYIVDGTICTGHTTKFNLLKEDAKPTVTITYYASNMYYWGFGICGTEKTIIPSISINNLNNINHTQVTLEK